jgi:hypothetical protein
MSKKKYDNEEIITLKRISQILYPVNNKLLRFFNDIYEFKENNVLASRIIPNEKNSPFIFLSTSSKYIEVGKNNINYLYYFLYNNYYVKSLSRDKIKFILTSTNLLLIKYDNKFHFTIVPNVEGLHLTKEINNKTSKHIIQIFNLFTPIDLYLFLKYNKKDVFKYIEPEDKEIVDDFFKELSAILKKEINLDIKIKQTNLMRSIKTISSMTKSSNKRPLLYSGIKYSQPQIMETKRVLSNIPKNLTSEKSYNNFRNAMSKLSLIGLSSLDETNKENIQRTKKSLSSIK